MAQVLVNESSLEDIADAIREKKGTSDTYTPSEMARAIRGIETGGDVTGVKGNAESEYRTGNVNITPANIGAKPLQTPVSSPSASGTAIEFIDSISQDAQGVITPTKKTVRVATTSQSGLMSATDKEDLNADTIAKNLIVKLRDELSYPIAEGSVVIRYISSSYRLYRAKTTISSDADDVEASWEYLSSNVYKSGYLSQIVYGIKTVHNAVATDVDNLVYPLQPYTIYHDEFGNMYQLGSSGADDASSAWWTSVPNLGYCVSENRRRIESVSNSASTARSMAQGLQASFAPFYYSGLFPIAAGQMVLYGSTNDKRLYRALVDIQEAEDFTAAHWEQVTVDELITALQAALAAAEAQRLAMYPTDTAEGASVAISDGADNLPLKAMQLRIASESGVTGVSVTRLGKNVANIADNSYTSGGVTFTMSGGAVRMTGTSTGTINRAIGTAQLRAGVTYTISGTKSSGITDANTLRIDLRNPGGSVIASGDSYNGFTYTPAADVTAQVNIRLASGQTIDATLYPQVEAGQAATSYTPYAPTVYAVDWSDVAGTAHDVVLDVLTGALTADGAAYAVTPVDVRTLLGANTFSADVGTLAVTWRADIGLYVARKIAEANA